MPSSPSSGDRPAPFACHWRLKGRSAASVEVIGALDQATAEQLERVLREALGAARLVLVDLWEMSSADSTGLQVIVEAAARARSSGARMIVTGAPTQVEALLEATGARTQLDVLRFPTELGETAPARRDDESAIRPLANPVNATVVTARVTSISDTQLWLQAADGVLHQPWTPPTDGLPVPVGTQVEVYRDAAGAVNGWYEPESGLAINQRCLEPGESPATYADLACEGPCGLVWKAPAGARLTRHEEQCLTCAGTLALR